MSQRRPYAVKPGKKLDLSTYDCADTGDFADKEAAEGALEVELKRLTKLQYKLHSTGSHALLIVLQGMDASGKDSIIRHLAAGLNPQGCEVTSFKKPTVDELLHDFLWRCHARTPRKGRIGIFNRSHYEDVIVTRVHPELLLASRLPGVARVEDVSEAFWTRRFAQIRDFEDALVADGTVILKFFLHLSRDEQKKRLLERIDAPEKNWKFELADVQERQLWDDYQAAYQDALAATSTESAPWFVIPADKKWFARAAIAGQVVTALESLGLKMPDLLPERRQELGEARRLLEKDA